MLVYNSQNKSFEKMNNEKDNSTSIEQIGSLLYNYININSKENIELANNIKAGLNEIKANVERKIIQEVIEEEFNLKLENIVKLVSLKLSL